MNKYRVNVYNPKEVNVPQLINKVLAEEKLNKTAEYLIFVQNDIVDKAINPDDLYTKYAEFCDRLNLPYAMYQYYNTFNRILPDALNKVNPRLIIHTDKYGVFDMVMQVAYGFLILNTQVLIDSGFVFNETYRHLFYVQDMIEYYYQHKLALSNFCILEMHDSELLFNEPRSAKTGYFVDMNEFNKEREAYFKVNKIEYKNINEIVEEIKKKYGSENGGVSTFSTNNISGNITNQLQDTQSGLIDIQQLINSKN